MDPGEQPELKAALERMWAKFLPQMLERVEVLAFSAQQFNSGQLSHTQRLEARDNAHKLAGVLGTFGLKRGTMLARELEMLYSMENGPHSAFGQRLVDNAGELKVLITFRR
jgi:HPt (histidine-containing phosphotransfer) domain-containing protein